MNARIHITIVDDDAHTLYFIERALTQAFPEGEIVKFSDGMDALHFLEKSDTDLLVTDHSMERMNGADLIRALRMRGSTLPIIMVSSSPDAEQQGTAAGANVFMDKEGLMTRLPAAARRLLGTLLLTRSAS